MPVFNPYVSRFPGEVGWYWADDGIEISLVWASVVVDEWVVWDPLQNHSHRPQHYIRWSMAPLMAPMPNDED